MDGILLYGNILVVVTALLEILWGIIAVTFGIIVHRSKLDLNVVKIIAIYLALLNPFTTRETAARVNIYLENL